MATDEPEHALQPVSPKDAPVADEDEDDDGDGEPIPVFEFRVSLTPAEIVAAFRDDDRVEWHAAGAPGAAPYIGKQFQAWPDGPNTLVVRHAVKILAFGPSPNVHIQWEPLERGGTLIRGKFLRRARPDPSKKWYAWAPLALLFGALYAFFLSPLYFVYLVLGAIGLFGARRLMSNKPTAQSMFHFGKPLWSLMGEKFVPHALGTGEDDPFRDRALPEGR